MKNGLMILLILLGIFPLKVKSQTDFFTRIDSNKIKIFYDFSGDITIEKYADYYRVAKTRTEYLYLEGEFSDFNLKGNKIFEGYFKNEKINELCKYFFKTGEVKEIGKLKDGIRDSIWNYYYQNGQIEKTIKFKDGVPFIMSFYAKNGKQRITNGTGKYTSEFYKDNGKHQKYKISGYLVDGKLDGKWKIPDVTMETFKNGEFIEGFDVIAYKNPQQIYLENILGYYCNENVELFQNNFFCTSCIKNVSWALYSIKGSINNYPFENFLSQFSKVLDSQKITTCSCLLQFETHSDGSIENIRTFGISKFIDNKVVENLLRNNSWLPLNCDGKSEGFIYMMIVKQNGKLYLPKNLVITNNKEANFMLKQMTNNNLLICQ